MKCLNVVVGTSFLLAFASLSIVASAAELYGEPQGPQQVGVHLHRKAVVALTACGRKCRSVCPDGYSCFPLYGDYGMPYGSPAFWARYTISGWGRY